MTKEHTKAIKKVIYVLKANGTDMVRYISGRDDEEHGRIVSKCRSSLKSTLYSLIGNDASREINPAWAHHRQAFIDSRVVSVSLFQESIPEEAKYKEMVSYIAYLNRKALSAATKDFRVSGTLRRSN